MRKLTFVSWEVGMRKLKFFAAGALLSVLVVLGGAGVRVKGR